MAPRASRPSGRGGDGAVPAPETRPGNGNGGAGLSPLLRSNLDRSERPTKTAALVARSLVNQIVTRRLQPGDMLAPEREMLAEFGVGRYTLREALRVLELQGVITLRQGPGGGPVVNRPDPRYLAGTLSMMLAFSQTPFRAIVATRALIEPAVAADAARRVDAEHLEAIRQSVERMQAHIGDIDVFLEENANFHDLIAWSSGNTVFGYLLSSLHWINDGTAMGVQYPVWAQKVVANAHARIYAALAAGDVEVATKEMTDHSQNYADYLRERYPEILDHVIRWDPLPG